MVDFNTRFTDRALDLPPDLQRRLCRTLFNVWTDIVGPGKRYAKGFYAAAMEAITTGEKLRWHSPSRKHVLAYRETVTELVERHVQAINPIKPKVKVRAGGEASRAVRDHSVTKHTRSTAVIAKSASRRQPTGRTLH